jgi:hypothetical protein
MANGPITQAATAEPVISFTPQKSYPSTSVIPNAVYKIASYANAGPNTLLYTDVLGGLIIHTAAGAQTDTLPTALLLVNQIEGGQAGSGIEFYVSAPGAGAITIAPGAGGTLVGSGVVAAGFVKAFLLIITAKGITPTYTMYSLGSSAA